MSELIMLSKSRWHPPIRREHALARLAAEHGHRVTFVESPADIRAAAGQGVKLWLKGLRGSPVDTGAPLVSAISRSTLIPGHRDRIARSAECWLLARIIERVPPGATVVTTLPWLWPAVRRLRGVRKVLDVADDWSELIPARAGEITQLYELAAREADEVIVVSERLRARFPSRRVSVVPNGVDERLLRTPVSHPPSKRKIAYVGTLSERFDAPLVEDVLQQLPDWSLDLYGQCAYRGQRDRPAPELTALLAGNALRVHWHGIVSRERVTAAIDSADVLLLPNRPVSRGQDSMKVYDYAARGRPIVATKAALLGMKSYPPRLYAADESRELARLVVAAGDEPTSHAVERRQWAEQQSWAARWPTWSAALFGS
jgi:glycosyltransferase involved in cell wall biosynthesis